MATQKVNSLRVRLQEGTDRTVYATWSITDPKSEVDGYSCEWRYYVGGVWFSGSTSTIPSSPRSTTYTAPNNALQVAIKLKPISKTYEKDGKDTTYFTGNWSSWAYYTFKEAVDHKPVNVPVPTVKISGYILTAQVDVYDEKNNTKRVQFEVVVNSRNLFSTGIAALKTNRAAYSCNINAGDVYKVRARGIKNDLELTGEWSEYSSETDGITLPPAIIGNIICRAVSKTSVSLAWTTVKTATSYTIEYANDPGYFDRAPGSVQSVTIETGTQAEITGLDSGEEWFFRIQAINDQGSSEWSNIVSAVVGKRPNPPTTWSSTTTALVGDIVYLYWVHNSADNSRESEAYIHLLDAAHPDSPLYINIKNETTEDEDTPTHQYQLKTSMYPSGTKLYWSVATKGVLPEFSDYSAKRLVEIFAPPTLNFMLFSKNDWYWDPFNFQNGNIYTSPGIREPLMDNILESFPLFIDLHSGPMAQKPLGYHISVVTNESYEETDDIGNITYIVAGQEVYSRYYVTNERQYVVILGPNDINLENGVRYLLTATVTMDSGLIGETSQFFEVQWGENGFELDAEFSFDNESVTAYIRPYCDNENGLAVGGILLSVYRREFDGGFTMIGENLSNILRPTVTDPHPTLNRSRYRIVGKSIYTGQVLFYDLPGYPVSEKAIVIQWNEEWSSYDVINGDELMDRPWSGSMLKLPYNVDVSESNDIDVEMVEYIGRRHPVSYYGTQVGQHATWSADIPKHDEETLYGLRRLSTWMGNVYVREPSGTGYWATIKVSFNQEHKVMIIPVTLDITRVDGGM